MAIWRKRTKEGELGTWRGFQTCILHEFPISAHIYYKPFENTEVSETKASWPNSDSDLYDQYPAAPKKSNGAGRLDIDWCTPFCPRNQFILSPCPAPALHEGETETGSAQRHPPRYRAQVSLYFSSEWCPGRRMNDREDYTFESRF